MEIPPTFRGAVLVAAGDEVVLEYYGGFADVSNDVRCRSSTRFQIASVSKQFAAACVLLLAEQNQLSLDDPLRRWFASSPASWDAVSLHELLTHTAGFGHFPDYDFDLHAPIDDDAFVHRLQQRPLPEELPSAWYYSSPAYGLLARIVERTSGLPYRDFLDERIFNRLGMSDTFAGDGHGRSDLAVGYTDDRVVPSMALDTLSMGAGDIWSTVRDVDRWNIGLLTDELLSPASRTRMFTPHADVDGFPIPAGYGYGWLITKLGDQQIYAHSGDNVGYTSLNIVAPASSQRVVILTNQFPADLLPLAISLLSTANG